MIVMELRSAARRAGAAAHAGLADEQPDKETRQREQGDDPRVMTSPFCSVLP
jgi:hypothetical protein